jgi:hypothetical protein
MMRPDETEHATFAQLHPDVVTKEDGRYLVYYSWPDDEEEPDATGPGRTAHPQPEPWTPQAGPADV